MASLFASVDSVSLPLTCARFVKTPAVVGVTTSVIVAVAPTPRVPNEQLTVLDPGVQVPWLGAAEINTTPAGSTSLTVTPDAGAGPLLVIVRVYTMLLPSITGSARSVIVIARSMIRGVLVGVGVSVGVLVGVAVGVLVGVDVGVSVCVGVDVGVFVGVAVGVSVGVVVGVFVGVLVGVSVRVGVRVGVCVGVSVGVSV